MKLFIFVYLCIHQFLRMLHLMRRQGSREGRRMKEGESKKKKGDKR